MPPPQDCGLVLESHAIDTRSEWRTFGDSVRDSSGATMPGASCQHAEHIYGTREASNHHMHACWKSAVGPLPSFLSVFRRLRSLGLSCGTHRHIHFVRC